MYKNVLINLIEMRRISYQMMES